MLGFALKRAAAQQHGHRERHYGVKLWYSLLMQKGRFRPRHAMAVPRLCLTLAGRFPAEGTCLVCGHRAETEAAQ